MPSPRTHSSTKKKLSRNEEIQAKFEAYKGLKVHFTSPVPFKKAIPYAIIFALYVGGMGLLHLKGASIGTEALVTLTALSMGVLTFITTNDRNRNR